VSVYRLKQHILARLDKIEKATKDPSKLIKQLSTIGLTSAEKSFKDQALGDIEWSERYPNMAPPVLNIAGAIKDFNAGRKEPKPNRFQDRPANVDEGTRGGLWGSLTITTDDEVVGWGSDKEYASLMQEGGTMNQDISEGAKERIQEYLYTGLFTEKAAKSKRSIEKKRNSVIKMEKKATVAVGKSDADWRAPTQKEIKKEVEWFNKKVKTFGKEHLKKRFTTMPGKFKKWKKRTGAGWTAGAREKKLFARYGNATNIQDAAYNKAATKKNKKRVSTFSSKVKKENDAKGYTREDLIPKLKWAINPTVHEWSHGIGARPFLGITDQTEVDMIEAVENFFRKAQA
jgi:phage gpG-like protein